MSQSKLIRLFAGFLMLGMFATACGQKSGVGLATGPAGGTATTGGAAGDTAVAGSTFLDANGDGIDDATGVGAGDFVPTDPGFIDPGTGEVLPPEDPAAGGAPPPDAGGGDPPADGAPAGGGGGGPAPAPGGPAPGQPPPAQPGPGQPAAQPAPAPAAAPPPQAAGNTTGITDKEIVIGIHSPLTGAAPIPQTSAQASATIYWNAIGPTIAGRKVRVILVDDKYNPASASQACQQLIQRDKVFILTGTGGTDQIAACSRIAQQAGVPYLSGGVTENPLRSYSTYFPFSQSYAQQGPLLVQWIKANIKPGVTNNVIPIIRTDTPNFDDGIAAFIKAAQAAGYTVQEKKLSKKPSASELTVAAQFIAQSGSNIAFPLMAPSDYLQVVKEPAVRNIQWVGIGLTKGLNTVANVACQSTANAYKAMFFSPWPGLNLADQLDPNFSKAVAAQQAPRDDFVWAGWGAGRLVHEAFKKAIASNQLTREGFIAALETPLKTGIYPDLNNTPQNHFSINQVHVLTADCGLKQFTSQPGDIFKTGF